MISTSVAVSSTITDLGTVSSAGGNGSHEGSTVDVSFEDEDEEGSDDDDDDDQRYDDKDGDEGASARSPPPANSKKATGEKAENNGGDGSETGLGTAGASPAAPPKRTDGDGNDKPNVALAGEAVAGNQDGGGGEGGEGGGGDGAGALNQTDDASA